MAKKVDTDEAVGYLVSCCIKDVDGDYQAAEIAAGST
jgi:hypothetical protein